MPIHSGTMKKNTIILIVVFCLLCGFTLISKRPEKTDPATVPNTQLLGGSRWKNEGGSTAPILEEIGWNAEGLSISQDGEILTITAQGHRNIPFLITENGVLSRSGKDSGLRLRCEQKPSYVLCLTSKNSRRTVYFERL